MPYQKIRVFTRFEKNYPEKRKKIQSLRIQNYVMHTKKIHYKMYKIRFAVEKKTKKILRQFLNYLVAIKKSWSYNF